MTDYSLEDWIEEIDGERPTTDICETMQKTETPNTGVFDYGRCYWGMLFVSLLCAVISVRMLHKRSKKK